MGLVTGAFASRLLVDPRADLLKLQGEIAEALLLYAPLYSNVGNARPDDRLEATQRVRALAARLVGACTGLPGFDAWARLGLVPTAEAIRDVHHALIGLSNGMSPESHEETEQNRDRRRIIFESFGTDRFCKVL
ncbi:hypothetical protein K2Z84_32055 [Candidatus Binatia bacterium]|nr:hypothetical protein [Candidatus Binatia bacterium]